MATVTIRSLSSETHRALKMRATQHGRSIEAEMGAILEEAVRPQERGKIGSALAAFGRRFGGVDLSIARDEGDYAREEFCSPSFVS
jgi:plasmid stability protein